MIYMKGKSMACLMAIALMISGTSAVKADVQNTSETKKDVISVPKETTKYKILDKDGNFILVEFEMKKTEVDVVVTTPNDSTSTNPIIITIPINSSNTGTGGGEVESTDDKANPNNSGVEQPQIVYSDIAHHWAREDILLLSILGMIKGYPDGTFRPDGTLTRAEFATMFESAIRKMGVSFTDKEKSFFSDVNKGNWFFSTIIHLESRGNIQEKNYKAKLEPNKPVPRQEMVSWMAMDVNKTQKELSFSDEKTIPNLNEVKKVASAGLISGFPDGTFRPSGNTTRAQAASIIVRFLKYKGIIANSN